MTEVKHGLVEKGHVFAFLLLFHPLSRQASSPLSEDTDSVNICGAGLDMMLSTKSVLKRSRWSRLRASRKQSTSIVEYPVWKRGDSNYYRAAKLHCSAMLSQFHCTYKYTRRFWIILHAQWMRSECESRRPTGALSSNGGRQVRTFTPAISEDRHEGKNTHTMCVYMERKRERERERGRRALLTSAIPNQSQESDSFYFSFSCEREQYVHPGLQGS